MHMHIHVHIYIIYTTKENYKIEYYEMTEVKSINQKKKTSKQKYTCTTQLFDLSGSIQHSEDLS